MTTQSVQTREPANQAYLIRQPCMAGKPAGICGVKELSLSAMTNVGNCARRH